MLMKFIGTDHIRYLVSVLPLIVFQTAFPKKSRIEDDFTSVMDEKIFIKGSSIIMIDRQGNVRTDVVFNIPGPDSNFFTGVVHTPFRGDLTAIASRFPSILSPFIPKKGCIFLCSIQGIVSVHQQLFCNIRIGVDKKGQHEDFRIPENMSFIAFSMKAFSPDGGVFID